MGSAVFASIVAKVTFWILVGYGLISDDLSRGAVVAWVIVWLAGVTLARFIPYGEALFPSVVAIADIVLVFVLFQGDVRLR